MSGKPLLSLRDLATEFGIKFSDSHIRRRCYQGTFPKPVRVGQGLRGREAWRREDIINFIAAL